MFAVAGGSTVGVFVTGLLFAKELSTSGEFTVGLFVIVSTT